jgi:hypothetical protein
MIGFWFAVGFLIRSWWALLGPVLVGLLVLVGLELIPDFDDRRLGDWLLYLGGGEEYWYMTFWIGLPFFALAAGLGHQLRTHMSRSRGTSTSV